MQQLLYYTTCQLSQEAKQIVSYLRDNHLGIYAIIIVAAIKLKNQLSSLYV